MRGLLEPYKHRDLCKATLEDAQRRVERGAKGGAAAQHDRAVRHVVDFHGRSKLEPRDHEVASEAEIELIPPVEVQDTGRRERHRDNFSSAARKTVGRHYPGDRTVRSYNV